MYLGIIPGWRCLNDQSILVSDRCACRYHPGCWGPGVLSLVRSTRYEGTDGDAVEDVAGDTDLSG